MFNKAEISLTKADCIEYRSQNLYSVVSKALSDPDIHLRQSLKRFLNASIYRDIH